MQCPASWNKPLCIVSCTYASLLLFFKVKLLIAKADETILMGKWQVGK
jgi:hypothetical protein